MSTFVVKQIEDFETNQKVNKLIRNGKCILDDFIKDINSDKTLAAEIGDLYAIIEDVANEKRVPKTKYRNLHLTKKLKFNPYEAKSKHLRLYLFHDKENGQIIVLGGKKGTQLKDLSKFEKIIQEYSRYIQLKVKP